MIRQIRDVAHIWSMNVLLSTLQKSRATENANNAAENEGMPSGDPPALYMAIELDKQRKEERKEMKKFKREIQRQDNEYRKMMKDEERKAKKEERKRKRKSTKNEDLNRPQTVE